MKSRCEILPLTANTLKQTIEGLPEPMLLLDSELRLYHLNAAARMLYAEPQRWSSTWRDPSGTDRSVDCLAPVLLGRPCSGPGPCTGCHLHDVLSRSLSRGESTPPLRVDRTLLGSGRVRTAPFELMARAVEADGSTGFLVTLRAVNAGQDEGRRSPTFESRDRDALRRPA